MQYLPPHDNQTRPGADEAGPYHPSAKTVRFPIGVSHEQYAASDMDAPWQRAIVGIFVSGPAFSILFYLLVWCCWQALN